MKILSQDKSKMVNLDNVDTVSVIRIASKYEVRAFNEDSITTIGEFENVEDAQEIISQIFQCKADTYIVPQDGKDVKTNADRIRSMSDEKLAEFLYEVSSNSTQVTICNKVCDKCAYDGECCTRMIEAWLKLESVDK